MLKTAVQSKRGRPPPHFSSWASGSSSRLPGVALMQARRATGHLYTTAGRLSLPKLEENSPRSSLVPALGCPDGSGTRLFPQALGQEGIVRRTHCKGRHYPAQTQLYSTNKTFSLRRSCWGGMRAASTQAELTAILRQLTLIHANGPLSFGGIGVPFCCWDRVGRDLAKLKPLKKPPCALLIGTGEEIGQAAFPPFSDRSPNQAAANSFAVESPEGVETGYLSCIVIGIRQEGAQPNEVALLPKPCTIAVQQQLTDLGRSPFFERSFLFASLYEPFGFGKIIQGQAFRLTVVCQGKKRPTTLRR